jgi:carbamoyl-phosphate synthase large subunit
VFVSVANRDKRSMIFPVKVLADLGFEILATEGTAEVLRRNGILATLVRKQYEGIGPSGEPTIVQRILDGDVDLIINTPYGVGPRLDGYDIRTAAVSTGKPCITTVQGLAAAVQGIEALLRGEIGVGSLQEHAERLQAHRDVEAGGGSLRTGRDGEAGGGSLRTGRDGEAGGSSVRTGRDSGVAGASHGGEIDPGSPRPHHDGAV